MAQAVICQPLASEFQVSFLVTACGNCGEKKIKSLGRGFSSVSIISPTHYTHFHRPVARTRRTNGRIPGTFQNTILFRKSRSTERRSQWPRGLRRMSSAGHLLRMWVRIPPGAWTFVCCDYFVLSGIGQCDGLITGPEESYRLWRVNVCDQETSKTRRLKSSTGL